MKKRVADLIVEILLENNITDCFSVVGGGSMHLNNAFGLCDKMNKVFNHHEQACAMAAEAYARAIGKPAVVCVTTGPGGLNALNGVEGAWADSLPMIVIAGQVRYETSVEYTGLSLRTRGIQEFDIVGSVKNMTKYAKIIRNPLTIRKELQKAIDISIHGRRGPVWLDIPLDVQNSVIETDELEPAESIKTPLPTASTEDIQRLWKEMKEAVRPCILTGSGIRTSDAMREFREFVQDIKVPIVGGSLQADLSYVNQPYYYGLSGNSGPRAGNFILQNSDYILVIGNSLSFKQTGFNQEDFAPNGKIVMVDVDENEAKKPGLRIYWHIHSDLKEFLKKAGGNHSIINANEEWLKYCNMIKERFPRYEGIGKVQPGDLVKAKSFWKEFDRQDKEDSIIALGNSTCITPKLQEGTFYPKQRVMVNYGCGSMGDDITEAIGIAVAMKKDVTCVTGDGSIMMNLQEFQTIIHYNLPIKTIIFSNDGYGAIKQTFKNFFNGHYTGCDKSTGVSFPNFQKIAEAFGLPYKRCSSNAELQESIQWVNETKGYLILEIMQILEDPVSPKVMSRINEDQTFQTPALHDMYPFLDQTEIDKLMLW